MKKPFSAYALKMTALTAMLFDHLNLYLATIFPLWFRYIGRSALPIFIFLSLESYYKTSNRKKFFFRLGMAALIVEAGDYLAWRIAGNGMGHKIPLFFIGHNYFLIMFLAVMIYYSFDRFFLTTGRWKKIVWLQSAILLSLAVFIYEGLAVSIGLIYVFYFTRKFKEGLMPYLYGAFSLWFWPSPQIFMIFALPLLLLYSGKRGRKDKAFFYLFYPLHRWILFLLGFYLGLR